MKLTINQALQLAITADKENSLQEAEKLYRFILEAQPTNLYANNNLGVLMFKLGKLEESEKSYRKTIELKPDYAEAHYNLGNTLYTLNRLEESVTSFKKTIELKPDYAEAHNNLSNPLLKLNKLDEAEASVKKAIELNPDYIDAYYNLGIICYELGKFVEAEISYRKIIKFKPDYAKVYYNLGAILYERGNLNEAEISYKKIIKLEPKSFEAYKNLGNVLRELARFEEAEVSCRKAIELKPDFAEAHYNLGITLYDLGRFEEAEVSYRKAIELKPDYPDAHKNLDLIVREKDLLLNIFYKKKTMNRNKATDINSDMRLTFNPFISHRDVEIELLKDLYKVNFKKLDKTEAKDARYGNGRCSDFKFLENGFTTIKTVAEDLISIMKQAVKSDVYIMDSFLNIYGAGSGTIPHKHISDFDKKQGLVNQKFSLTYYLAVGDKNCSEPGNLKVYEPNDEILLSDGKIVIIPAFRTHSAVYNGKKDRVMIGVNFYSLL